ncbi:MAG TPA: hypothetical protein VIT44_02175, partial [Cyclobacteriaceae bacterium]
MKNVVLFGGGLHASCCIDVIEKEGIYTIVGIIDSIKVLGEELYGYKVIGRQEQLKELTAKYNIHGGLIAIGDNWSRRKVYEVIVAQIPDFKFINAIHPSVILGRNVKLGMGNVVMAGCVINPSCIVGDFSFFTIGVRMEHDCILG